MPYRFVAFRLGMGHFGTIIDQLAQQGAEGVILGCTEIPLLIHQSDPKTPLFDTSYLHSIAAADYALKNN